MRTYITRTAKDMARIETLITTQLAGTPLAFSPETDEDYADGVEISGEHIEIHCDHLPYADNSISNGSSDLKRYQVDGSVWLIIETGDNTALHFVDAGSTWSNFFKDWDFGDFPWHEGVACFGIDATPDEAADDATDVCIWVAYDYYSGTCNAPTDEYLRDDRGEIMVFATVVEAQAHIDELESGVYYTSHGEAGRPTYTICEW